MGGFYIDEIMSSLAGGTFSYDLIPCFVNLEEEGEDVKRKRKK